MRFLMILLLLIAGCSQKLRDVNYIDISPSERGLSISYHRENPLKEEEKPVKLPPPECSEGEGFVALWIWDLRKLERRWKDLVSAVKRLGVKRVYLQLSRRLKREHIEKIKDMGLEVYLLDGGRDGLNFPVSYVKKFPADGFQIDIEPYQNPDFNLRREWYARKLLEEIRRIKRELGNVKLSVVVPFWYEKVPVGKRSLIELIFEEADEVVVMAYRNNLSEALKLSGEEIALGKKLGKPVLIGLEINPQRDEKHYVYKVGERFLELVGIYEVKGKRLTFPRDKVVDLKSVACDGVKGFVIHSFEAL